MIEGPRIIALNVHLLVEVISETVSGNGECIPMITVDAAIQGLLQGTANNES
jgi:hypothetical protein